MASDAVSDEQFEREFEELAQIYDVLRRDALHLIKDLDDGVWAFRLGALLMFSLTAGFAGYSAYFFLLWGAFLGSGYYPLIALSIVWTGVALAAGEFFFYRPYRRLKHKYSQMFEIASRAEKVARHARET